MLSLFSCRIFLFFGFYLCLLLWKLMHNGFTWFDSITDCTFSVFGEAKGRWFLFGIVSDCIWNFPPFSVRTLIAVTWYHPIFLVCCRSKVHSYDEVVERVARRIGLDDSSKIRLTAHNCYSQQPKPQPIKYRGVEHLSDMLVHYNQVGGLGLRFSYTELITCTVAL